MSAKDRFVGWLFMGTWLLFSHLPLMISTIIGNIISKLPMLPAVSAALLICVMPMGAFITMWLILRGAELCTRPEPRIKADRTPERSEFEKVLWKSK